MATVKEFLESYPLYRKFPTDQLLVVDQKHRNMMAFSSGNPGPAKKIILRPPINAVCPTCRSVQTYNIVGDYGDDGFNFIGMIFRADYVCSSCRRDRKVFFLLFTEEAEGGKGKKIKKQYAQKVGQFPSWNIQPEEALQKLLGSHQDYFRKGLICESHGYGIGAYGYFRRITEEVIDQLLDSIADVLDEAEKVEYAEALEKTKQTRVAQEKIDLVKDLLPVSLRPDGINPLDTLHSALSEGLHAEDDEACLEYADAIKNVLVYLINQILKKKEDAKIFTASMKKLLDKKAKKKITK